MMLNIAIPMAGLGSRFANVGYSVPKPLIPVHGVPMIRFVIANIKPSSPHRFIFICQRNHVRRYSLRERLAVWAPGSVTLEVDGVTKGAACTVLVARQEIDNDQPLMIANSDQYVNVPIDPYINSLRARDLDGVIMTMTANDPKWSYASVDSLGLVSRVAEKEVISTHATVGLYSFRRGADFVRAADQMIAQGLSVNNEFYVAPVYNQLIKEKQRIGVYDIGTDGIRMHGLGTPGDLDAFCSLPLAVRVAEELR